MPGLSDAVAERSRCFADRWPTAGALATAEAAERGEPMTVDGQTVWLALFGARSPLASRFEYDENAYLLTAPDELEQQVLAG